MARLTINNKAELKIKLAMLKLGSREVTWLGKIKVSKNGNYILSDIFFPPQENDFAFVTTQDDKFPTWFFETFVKRGTHTTVRLHGHTHPYFMTNPSGTDQQQFKEFMSQVDDYMIQLILSNTKDPHCELWNVDGTKEKLEVYFEYSEKINKVLEEMCDIEKRKGSKYNRVSYHYDNKLDIPLDPDIMENYMDDDDSNNLFNLEDMYDGPK